MTGPTAPRDKKLEELTDDELARELARRRAQKLKGGGFLSAEDAGEAHAHGDQRLMLEGVLQDRMRTQDRSPKPCPKCSIVHARSRCHDFFPWYDTEHHHSGIAMLTPHDLHHGLAEQRLSERALVLEAAFHAHPERFPHGLPKRAAVPSSVWINKPLAAAPTEESLQ